MQAKTFLYTGLISLTIFAASTSASGFQQNQPAPALEDSFTAKASDPPAKQTEVLATDAPGSDKEVVANGLTRSRRKPQRPDFNRDIYYKNKLERSIETGWLPN